VLYQERHINRCSPQEFRGRICRTGPYDGLRAPIPKSGDAGDSRAIRRLDPMLLPLRTVLRIAGDLLMLVVQAHDRMPNPAENLF
jgi:hypothetical protein